MLKEDWERFKAQQKDFKRLLKESAEEEKGEDGGGDDAR